MSDKEPRRRKKRKDQSKKDDVQFQETTYVPQKEESRDSDQEADDDHFVATQHEPSKIAKIVFTLMFSALVVTMSVVFVALRGAERGPVDIFDMNHHESAVDIEENHVEDVEVWNVSEQYTVQQYEDEHIEESIDVLQGTEVPDVEGEEELVRNVFYKTEENVEEISLVTPEAYDEGQFETTHTWHEEVDEALSNEDDDDSKAETYTADAESETRESQSEILMDSSLPEEPHSVYEALAEEEDEEEEKTAEHELETEPPITEQSDVDEGFEERETDMGDVDSSIDIQEETIETETSDAESVPPYEKLDITSEDDYSIKEELDDIDSILDKDDTEEDDDVYEAEEDFDFWHF